MEQTEKRYAPSPKLRIPVPAVLSAVLLLLIAAVAVHMLLPDPAPDPAEVEKNVPPYVAQEFLEINPWSRPGKPLEEVNGVVLHYVGNPGTSAMANRNYFNSLADGSLETYASSHFIIGLEGEVIQCVPLDEIAYASNTRNGDTISIEACHPDETGRYRDATYKRVVELTAWLCRAFRLDPAEDVLRHYDVSGKQCPLYYVENEEAWERLLADVAGEMEAQEAGEEAAEKES